ncbi:MdBV-4-1 [Microplitis demolitor]|nr:MdBV-4-1 [Microplitis demolitor]
MCFKPINFRESHEYTSPEDINNEPLNLRRGRERNRQDRRPNLNTYRMNFRQPVNGTVVGVPEDNNNDNDNNNNSSGTKISSDTIFKTNLHKTIYMFILIVENCLFLAVVICYVLNYYDLATDLSIAGVITCLITSGIACYILR